MPGGTSTMPSRLTSVNISRLTTAPSFISRTSRFGRSLSLRVFSLGNHSARNVICFPLYALVSIRSVKFDSRERDGKGSSIIWDQDRDSEYRFRPAVWKRGDSPNVHSANRPVKLSLCRFGGRPFNRRTSLSWLAFTCR
uniref:Uncharacterized protein n=1 Tax=Triticum urartu TaxID=4572 RepID=A0A8R7Q529_TRIUA